MEYAVHVQVAAGTPVPALDIDAAAEQLTELLEHAGAVISASRSGAPAALAATFTVDSDNPISAVATGADMWRSALAEAGVPDWPVVRRSCHLRRAQRRQRARRRPGIGWRNRGRRHSRCQPSTGVDVGQGQPPVPQADRKPRLRSRVAS